MQCIEIVRRFGRFGITRVIVTAADGCESYFDVGRHVGDRRIYELARPYGKYKGETNK
ncbi:hypothetical protein [Sporosarcina obsidiansis]|uniref:hypothetical protein n=1 Tax=Sporosarcina obsidiansis TaxID=2660748 RepID=UPI00129B9B4F|nr:hypothetical protein [Sporosarcina obsidiansis]